MTAVAESSTPAPSSVAAQWARYEAARVAYEGDPDNISAEQWAALSEINRFVLVGSIQSRADAIAKLHAAIGSIKISTRTDGADVEAMVRVVAWIEGRP